MNFRKPLLWMGVLFLFAAALSSQAPLTDGLPATLEREIPRLMKEADIPGLSMAIVRDGKTVWSGVFGVQSRATNVSVDENTMFEAASLTKTVTAFSALLLVDRGSLDLDRPLHLYFPEGKYEKLAGDPRYEALTARLILTHTTGLPNWGTRLIREPGLVYGYSGEGFEYLGRAIEQISGLSLQDFARKEIFEPLGMAHTSYVWNETYEANGAAGHDQHGYPNPKRKNTEPNGGASLLTTARDYAAFLCAIMNGQGLKKETIERMTSPQVRAAKWGKTELDEHISWGFGWGIQPVGSGFSYWHWGDNGDLRAYTVTDKETKTGFAFFANSLNGLSIVEAVTALVMGGGRPQYVLEWLDYMQFDNPRRAARMAIEKSFLTEGKEAGLRKLREAQGQTPDLYDENALIETADYLDGKGKAEEAVAILQICVEKYPQSMNALIGLGASLLGSEKYEAAVEYFGKALKINPENPRAKRGAEWAAESLKAEREPVALTEEAMALLAGDYGPRRITLREGRLYYQREGRPEYRLKALNPKAFALEGYAPFRIQFVVDEQGKSQKLVGLYLEGRTDESPRSR